MPSLSKLLILSTLLLSGALSLPVNTFEAIPIAPAKREASREGIFFDSVAESGLTQEKRDPTPNRGGSGRSKREAEPAHGHGGSGRGKREAEPAHGHGGSGRGKREAEPAPNRGGSGRSKREADPRNVRNNVNHGGKRDIEIEEREAEPAPNRGGSGRSKREADPAPNRGGSGRSKREASPEPEADPRNVRNNVNHGGKRDVEIEEREAEPAPNRGGSGRSKREADPAPNRGGSGRSKREASPEPEADPRNVRNAGTRGGKRDVESEPFQGTSESFEKRQNDSEFAHLGFGDNGNISGLTRGSKRDNSRHVSGNFGNPGLTRGSKREVEGKPFKVVEEESVE